jgi:SAM-dependent methyltransferase
MDLRANTEANAVYDQRVTDVYDLFYAGRGQDFANDGASLTKIILDRKPDARSVLDVGCGTGEHLRALAGFFDEVAGVELSAAMCELARTKLPGSAVHQGDMREFDLGRTFDAVCSLTSTVGYLASVDELGGALAVMAGHLPPGGVLVIDPYWSPENFIDGHIGHAVVSDDTRTVTRLSHTTRDGIATRHEAHYLMADSNGICHFTHVQPLHLFTRDEYLAAFERAGCTAEHVEGEGGFAARGLFVGVRKA